MFVFKSTYNAVVAHLERALDENAKLCEMNSTLRTMLADARKNDYRDVKGKFTKAPAKPKKCKVK